MKSTIRIKQDFDRNEPFIQLKLDTDQDVDLADSVLIHFVQLASNRGLELTFSGVNSNNNGIVEIRLNGELKRREGYSVDNNSLAFTKYLRENGINYTSEGHSTFIHGDKIPPFDLGMRWARVLEREGIK